MSRAVDTFARDRLPAAADLPDLVFDLPELQDLMAPARFNVTTLLLDRWVAQGQGDRPCLIGADGRRWSYAEVSAEVSRMARVLVDDLGLIPGQRVLLRGANSPRLAMCFLAVFKAGGIAVGTMPLLRARELAVIIDKAQIGLALCDARLADELTAAQATTPVLQRVVLFKRRRGLAAGDGGSDPARPVRRLRQRGDDICLMAFTSGTTGQPKAAMHFHRDSDRRLPLLAAACAARHA